jgi:hypothetical protein
MANSGSKGFWGGMFRTRERFSLEELNYLYDTLVKHPVVTESNKVSGRGGQVVAAGDATLVAAMVRG